MRFIQSVTVSLILSSVALAQSKCGIERSGELVTIGDTRTLAHAFRGGPGHPAGGGRVHLVLAYDWKKKNGQIGKARVKNSQGTEIGTLVGVHLDLPLVQIALDATCFVTGDYSYPENGESVAIRHINPVDNGGMGLKILYGNAESADVFVQSTSAQLFGGGYSSDKTLVIRGNKEALPNPSGNGALIYLKSPYAKFAYPVGIIIGSHSNSAQWYMVPLAYLAQKSVFNFGI